MRAIFVAFVCGVALAATSVQAAPAPTNATPAELGVVPPVELMAQGCRLGARQEDLDAWTETFGRKPSKTVYRWDMGKSNARAISPSCKATEPGPTSRRSSTKLFIPASPKAGYQSAKSIRFHTASARCGSSPVGSGREEAGAGQTRFISMPSTRYP